MGGIGAFFVIVLLRRFVFGMAFRAMPVHPILYEAKPISPPKLWVEVITSSKSPKQHQHSVDPLE